jgi:hypothetical protein
MELSGQLHAPASLPFGKEAAVPMRLDGAQTPAVQPVARHYPGSQNNHTTFA